MERDNHSRNEKWTGIMLGILVLTMILLLNGCSSGGAKKNDSGGSSNDSSDGKKGNNSTSSIKAGSNSNKNSSNSGANDVLISRNTVFFYDGTNAFFVGLAGKEIDTVSKEEGESYRAKVSLYGDKAVIYDVFGKLYYYDGNTPVLIDDDVSDVIISPDGSTCVYEKYDEESNFYLYWYSNGVCKLVTYEDVSNHYCDHFLLSFDGKYVGYSVIDDDGSHHSYLCDSDNNVIDLGKEYYILAVSTNADYLYYSTDALGERDFYIQCGLQSDKRVLVDHCGDHNAPNMYFNYDGTEMLIDAYSTSDKVYVKGEPGASVAGTPFFLDQTIVLGNGNFSSGITLTNVKTFMNVITAIYDSPYISYYFIGNDGILETFADNVYYSGSKIVSGNHEIICRVEDRIVKFTEKKGKVQQETLVSQNADSLFVAEDGSRFFYRDESGALYFVEGSKKTKLAAETSDEWSYPIRIPNGRVFDNKYLYYGINDDYYVTDGSKTDKLGGVFGDLKELHVDNCYVWMITEYDRVEHVFASSDGLNFTQLE